MLIFAIRLQLLSESAQVGGAEGAVLHPRLKGLVEYIWAEATGELEEVGTAISIEYMYETHQRIQVLFVVSIPNVWGMIDKLVTQGLQP